MLFDENRRRQECENYLLENMEQFDIVSINLRDLRLLRLLDLVTLYEVCRDRKNYNLAKSHLDFDPHKWNEASLKTWIDFVSEKYVDNNKVDMSKGESLELEEKLRDYWRSQRNMWEQAAKIYELLKTLSSQRSMYERILQLSRSLDLSSVYPPYWTNEDEIKFCGWFQSDIDSTVTDPLEFFSQKKNMWKENLEVMRQFYGINLSSPESLEDEEDEEEMVEVGSEMSPSSVSIPDFTPSPTPPYHEVSTHFVSQPIRYTQEFTDPEDWDRDQLNRWLQMEFDQFGIGFDIRNLPERRRRLIMIYVRCAWPCDTDKNSLAGISRIFSSEEIGAFLYNDILKMRPAIRTPDTATKSDSQRHRNRRDLHLWEFLLILLANQDCEGESIKWKDQSRGIFELANRQKVAKLWGLTKGNAKMTYDNMSRSVRQYYKDDKTGIMIRHQTGTQSLGKYSYQFSMNNNEVQKLWKSLFTS